MKSIIRIHLVLSAVVLLLVGNALSAQDTGNRINNIVLVHGAWVDGSGWRGVYDILTKKGYNVSVVQEPETSFQADVTATSASWRSRTGPASSWGTATEEASSLRLEMTPSSSVWCISRRTCPKVKPAMESCFPAS